MYTIGLKKTEGVWISPKTEYTDFELDEVFHFINRRERTETKENTYVMTMISRSPRQIVGFAVENTRSPSIIQEIVDSTAHAQRYHTDGYSVYQAVDFFGRLKQNEINKSDTHNVESINSDLRHYIPGLRRRSRVFYRTLETFRAVLSVFIDAYNKFGEYKLNRNGKRFCRSVFDFL